MVIDTIKPTSTEVTIKIPKEFVGKQIRISASEVKSKKTKKDKLLEAIMCTPTYSEDEIVAWEDAIKDGWKSWKIPEF